MRQLLQLAVQAVLAMIGKYAPSQLHHHYFHLVLLGLFSGLWVKMQN
jgi:hypothetical protein